MKEAIEELKNSLAIQYELKHQFEKHLSNKEVAEQQEWLKSELLICKSKIKSCELAIDILTKESLIP